MMNQLFTTAIILLANRFLGTSAFVLTPKLSVLAKNSVLSAKTSTISTSCRFSSPSSAAEGTSDVALPTKGAIVTVDCRLQPEGDFVPEPLIDGIVFEDYDPPQRLTFVLGEGNYLPGLHDLISTMKVGQETEISMDAGWGERHDNLVVTLSFDTLKDSGIEKSQIKEGVKMVLSRGVPCVVTKVTEEDFTIDANPPLAGASYNATVKLIDFESPISFDLEYKPNDDRADSKYQVATFALGCFWGGELAFMREQGVVGTKVGYTQGEADNPSYKEVCTGTTGHTEAIMVTYDSDVIEYEKLVHLTMDRLGENKYLLNQVGNDKGTQYRHGVYYHNDAQMEVAKKVIDTYGEDCVTECLPATKFYVAEELHQQYLLKGGQSARKGEDTTIRCYG